MNWVVELTYTPFVSMFPLHSCIVFLCQLLLFPQWNFFLPAFLNQLFLAFELRFILCTLAYSYCLTPGSWQKTSASAWTWRLHFLSRGGPGDMSSSSFCVWEIPTPAQGPLWLCTDQQQNYRGFFGGPCGLAHGSVWILQLWLGVVGCFTSGWDFIAQSGCADKGSTISMPHPM